MACWIERLLLKIFVPGATTAPPRQLESYQNVPPELYPWLNVMGALWSGHPPLKPPSA